MIMPVFQVALGGALGAVLRFGTVTATLRLFGPGFPLGVLTVNVVGSVLMGIAAIYVFERNDAIGPFVMTGLLGGFTTFSAFSLDAVALFERGQPGGAGLYVLLSVALSIAGLAMGTLLGRAIWA